MRNSFHSRLLYISSLSLATLSLTPRQFFFLPLISKGSESEVVEFLLQLGVGLAGLARLCILERFVVWYHSILLFVPDFSFPFFGLHIRNVTVEVFEDDALLTVGQRVGRSVLLALGALAVLDASATL